MLLENELSAGKVTLHPNVVLEPVTSIETNKIEEENPEIFPSCTVTRAQAKAKDKIGRFFGARDEIIDLSHIILNHDIDFKYSLKKKNSVGNVVLAMDVSLSRRESSNRILY